MQHTTPSSSPSSLNHKLYYPGTFESCREGAWVGRVHGRIDAYNTMILRLTGFKRARKQGDSGTRDLKGPWFGEPDIHLTQAHLLFAHVQDSGRIKMVPRSVGKRAKMLREPLFEYTKGDLGVARGHHSPRRILRGWWVSSGMLSSKSLSTRVPWLGPDGRDMGILAIQ